MNKQEQDKLWNDLSEESREIIRQDYMEEKKYSYDYCDSEDDVDPYSTGTTRTLEGIFGEHNLQPSLTYEDVERELFGTGIDGKCQFATVPYMGMKWNNKLQAIGRLLVVAKFLNRNEDGSDWVPNWNYVQYKWYLTVKNGMVKIDYHYDYRNSHIVYFRTKEIAQQAVQILGEDVIRTALTTDY